MAYTFPGLKFRNEISFDKCKYDIRPDYLLDVVCDFFGLPDWALKKGCGRGNLNITHPRQIAIYLLCTETNMSLKDIGIFMGGYDHTSVLHNRQQIQYRMRNNESVKAQVELLLNKLK